MDWVKKGSVSKDKLPDLWRYFSDVVGPSHWGLSSSEWPSGLTQKASEADADEQSGDLAGDQSSSAMKLVEETLAKNAEILASQIQGILGPYEIGVADLLGSREACVAVIEDALGRVAERRRKTG